MFPLGFVIGAVAGAAVVLVLGAEVAMRARPVAKAAVKAALLAIHESQVRGAEITEAAEDLYAEAKAEATADVFAATMAAAQAKATAQAAQSPAQEPGTKPPSTRPPSTKAAQRRAAVKRSRAMPSAHE
jgi:hypothetical protein